MIVAVPFLDESKVEVAVMVTLDPEMSEAIVTNPRGSTVAFALLDVQVTD